MKANLKGLGGIKGLALHHGEKIVIAVVGLLALWFVYSSLKLPSLDDNFQVDRLRSEINATNTAIQNSTWPGDSPDAPGAGDVRPYKPLARAANVKVDPGNYPIQPLDPRVMSPSLLRTDPEILNAEDIEVTAGSGLLAFRDEKTIEEQARKQRLAEEERARKAAEEARRQAQQTEQGGPGRGRGPGEELASQVFDPDHPDRRLIEGVASPAGVPLQGGERLERAHWAIVVAKVPIRKQLELYQDAFENARGGFDPARDFPQYVGYVVERCDVVDGKQGTWRRVYVYDGQKKNVPGKPVGKFVNLDIVTKLGEIAARDWAGQSIEPVDARWTDQVLTLPLPPLVGRDFGEEATHSEIPLAKDAPPPEDMSMQQQPLAAAAEQPAGEDDEEPAFTAGSQQPGGITGSPYGAGPTRGPMSGFGGREFGPMPRMPYGPSAGFGEFAGPPGGRGFGGPEGGGRAFAGGISTGARTTIPREVNDLLLRFFDFTVEPGKQYQYRVRLAVADPNNSIPLTAGMLDPSVIDRRSKEIRAAKEKGRQPPWSRQAAEWSEPSRPVAIPVGIGMVHIAEAKLPQKANDEPTVKVMAETFDIEPADGSAIHVAQETEVRRGTVVNLRGKMKYFGENDRWVDTKSDYQLYTGQTVVDVLGGEQLPGSKLTAPARVVLMDVAGQFTIRDELSDREDVEYLRYLLDEKRRQRSGGPGAEYGFEGPGRIPGGRGRGP